jgi:D-alanyl-D-alanine dipeptidase
MRKVLVLIFLLFINNVLANELKKSNIDLELKQNRFFNIQSIDSTLKVDLKYSSKNNFLGKDVYGDLNKCYLHNDFPPKKWTRG